VESTRPRLHREIAGAGPAVVFAHGLAGSARNWRPQVRALRDQYRTAVFDARGHARSEAPLDPDAYSLGALVADFGRVASEASAERPVVAVGLSLGAATALAFAQGNPDRVRALVLASFPGGRTAPGALGARANTFAERIDAEGLERAGEQFVWGPDSGLDPAARPLVRQGFLEHPGHVLAALLRGVVALLPSPADWRPSLSNLALPTLVIAGRDDASSLPTCCDLAAGIHGACLEVIEGAGHVANLAQPGRFNVLLQSFLESLPAAENRR
jgi:3-oxoadipate enol-lactonase